MSGGTPLSFLSDLPGPARVGLRDRGIDTLEGAVALSDEELVGIKGVKEASLNLLRGWQLAQGSSEWIEHPQDERARNILLAVDAGVRGGMEAGFRTRPTEISNPGAIALSLLLELVKRVGYSPEHPKRAWEMARLFASEAATFEREGCEEREALVKELAES